MRLPGVLIKKRREELVESAPILLDEVEHLDGDRREKEGTDQPMGLSLPDACGRPRQQRGNQPDVEEDHGAAHDKGIQTDGACRENDCCDDRESTQFSLHVP